MLTYTKFSRLSLAAKIKLHEKFTSEMFYRENIPIYGSRKSLSEQHGTKGCLGNYQVQITEKQH